MGKAIKAKFTYDKGRVRGRCVRWTYVRPRLGHNTGLFTLTSKRAVSSYLLFESLARASFVVRELKLNFERGIFGSKTPD